MTRWEDGNNENMQERFGMGPCVNGVVEWVKRNCGDLVMWRG